MSRKLITVAVACHDANGCADIPLFTFSASKLQIELGEHYDTAKKKAEQNGYEGPFVCFDHSEQPALRRAVECLS